MADDMALKARFSCSNSSPAADGDVHVEVAIHHLLGRHGELLDGLGDAGADEVGEDQEGDDGDHHDAQDDQQQQDEVGGLLVLRVEVIDGGDSSSCMDLMPTNPESRPY